MRVMHSYCLNYNYGDYALGFGVKNMLREIFDVSYFAECNLQGQIFDDYFISILNEKYDLLVIGGGGIIHGAHWPQGWFWLIEKENIKKLKIPFIVYGAGYNYFKDEEGIPEKRSNSFKRNTKKSIFFSVRNDGSHKRLLDQTGIEANVIADPGFWFGLNYRNINMPDEKYIVVQLADDKPLNRFGNFENRSNFIKNLNVVLKELESKYKIVFVPHVYEDIELSKDVAKGLQNFEVLDFSHYAFDHTYEALGIYKNAEFALAMRGHGQIVPLGFNVPVISLENHHKHRGLMEEYGLGNYNVDVLNADFINLLNSKIYELETNKSYIQLHTKKQNDFLFKDSIEKLSAISELKRFLTNK